MNNVDSFDLLEFLIVIGKLKVNNKNYELDVLAS